ncbi:MAG: polysaccharide biosynthesis protein [Ruminococcaceae bacterium]|nr:polysaccharide biosynthesis protein [Oscillospiraceae bacterium]
MNYVISAAVVLASYLLVMRVFGVNKVIWRYASSGDYLKIFFVTTASGLLACLILEFTAFDMVPTLFNFLGALSCSLVLTFSRIFYREVIILSSNKAQGDEKRLLIVGAGAAGSRMIDEIKTNPACGLNPIGFIDDDPQKVNRILRGVKVLGKISDIEKICKENKIELIYIAIPSSSNEQRAYILEECAKTTCSVKILPYYTSIADDSGYINKVRDITPEELLGREPIKVAGEDILSFVKDKVIAITGGGGSIGSELCRQIAANSPKRLIIIDVYENCAYAIQQELKLKYGTSLDTEVYIATVCDFKKINSLFKLEKPDVVIHAAAHKHVPLMETVPDECVKNNVFGTLNTALATRNNGIKKFILISTDKAVNPTNIMGATKRICEMIIQYVDSISPETTFAAVRFGNVLGSNGSVIPLFKNQIEKRQDVTVTHPEMIRYFMTIPEASQLVLTASAMANGGEIFVLDMGKPVKIDDLARKMISLSGLVIGKDINIKYVGLRPGEKLYEELLMSEEGLRKTLNEKIFIGNAIHMDYEKFQKQLDELGMIVETADVTPEQVEDKLKEIVPTFKRYVPVKVEDTVSRKFEIPVSAAH